MFNVFKMNLFQLFHIFIYLFVLNCAFHFSNAFNSSQIPDIIKIRQSIEDHFKIIEKMTDKSKSRHLEQIKSSKTILELQKNEYNDRASKILSELQEKQKDEDYDESRKNLKPDPLAEFRSTEIPPSIDKETQTKELEFDVDNNGINYDNNNE